MNRSFIVRVLGILAVALGLTLTATTTSVSAQVVDSVTPAASAQTADQAHSITPGSTSVAADQLGRPARNAVGQSGGVSTQQAERCGYWLQYDSYYTHCGSGSIVIHVDTSWWGTDRDITVWPGRTNLSQHWELKNDGGWIYGAYCIQRC